MPASNSQMIHKLQVALNTKGMKILNSRSQFYSEQQNRPVTIYRVEQAIYEPEKMRDRHELLFSSASEIQVVLFMRNLWYLVNDKPIPPTNQMKGAAEFDRKWNEYYNKYTREHP